MGRIVYDASMLAGAGLVVAGVAMTLGAGAALIAAGVLVMTLTRLALGLR